MGDCRLSVVLLKQDGAVNDLEAALIWSSPGEKEQDDVVKETDRVLCSWKTTSGSGDDSLELGIHEFIIGDDELLRSIFYVR